MILLIETKAGVEEREEEEEAKIHHRCTTVQEEWRKYEKKRSFAFFLFLACESNGTGFCSWNIHLK